MRIRKSNIPYLSHGSIGFEIDLDFAWLLNRVSGSQEEVVEHIERIMREGQNPEKGQVKRKMSEASLANLKQYRNRNQTDDYR